MTAGRRAVRVGVLAAVLSCGALLGASTAQAAFITVNTTADEFGAGAGCGLREAIQAANTNAAFGGCSTGAGDDQIDLLAPGLTYPRTRTGAGEELNSTGDFDVGAGSLAIVGHGAVIQGTDTSAGDRLFHKTGTGLLHLVKLTLRDGFTTGTGGAVLVDGGAVGITQATVTSNHAGLHGGGVETLGTAVFSSATVSGNTANGDGGGIDSGGASGNAIFDSSTVTQNVADADAGGPTTGRGGGVSIFLGTGNLRNTIVAGNADLTTAAFAPDCYVATSLGSGGYNLIGNPTGCEAASVNTGDIRGADAMLAPLASNGGDSQTHGLYPTSSAVDAGSPTVCNPTDQRNMTRPVGPRCDIGAFEGTVPLPPAGSVPPNPVPATTTPTSVPKKCKKKRKKGRSAGATVAAKKKKRCKKKRRRR